MPPRVQKEYIIALRDEDHLEAFLNSEIKRLLIVDVHLSWCGPCNLLINSFKTICMKIDDWDKRMQFMVGDVDKLPSLAQYQNSSKPKFVFFLGSKVVAEVDGVDVPQIIANINRYIPSLED